MVGAAHAAPSVGHSQPWRFLVVDDAAVRERAAVMADAERIAKAAQLDLESGQRLLDLQLEGIREAPLGVVVCCDRPPRLPGCWVGPRSPTPMCGRVPARSKSFGSPPGRKASGWGG